MNPEPENEPDNPIEIEIEIETMDSAPVDPSPPSSGAAGASGVSGPGALAAAPSFDMRRARRAGAALAISVVIDMGALAWLASHHHHGLPTLVAAAGAHLLAATIVLIAGGVEPSQRLLSAALTLSLPVAGAPVAAFILGTVGRSGIVEARGMVPDASGRTSPEELRRMAEGLSCAEALLASEVEERRAILSALSRHPDRRAVALLRWALASRHPDLAVEAALALEDVGASFDAHVAAGRAELAKAPSFEAALGVAESITHGIEAGIADASLVPSLAHEARQCYASAAELDPARFDVAAVGLARMELAVLRPDNALAVIDRAMATATGRARGELIALRQEAVLASHSLPWEGPSALATYRRPLPRAGTGRRHALIPILGTEVPRGRV